MPANKTFLHRASPSIVLCLLLAFAVSGCGKKNADEEDTGAPRPEVQVKISPVRTGDVADIVTATGSTVLRREAQMRSPITGIITRFRLFNGDSVRDREVVAEVRSKESQASIQGAEELVRTAQTDQQRSDATKALELAITTANAILLRAPFPGILINKAKSEMEVIAEGDSIATIVDPSSMIFLAQVPSASLNQVHPGQTATIRFINKTRGAFDATVHAVEPQINPTDQTANVQIAFTGGHPPLEESLFGEASIIVGKKAHVLLVPASAILTNDETGAASVMVVRGSIAIKTDVEVGLKRDSLVEISSPGLKEGTPVITLGNYGLPDSSQVVVER